MNDELHGPHEHADRLVLGPGLKAEDIEGLEMFTLRSVGIDIGSSTTHLVFSSLTLRREGASLSARFRVTDREVLYRSPILLTPYLSETLIDADKVKEFIHSAYVEGGFSPYDIDTGAVVITGEALKKENAEPIVDFFAQESGRFCCASAGPNHEALLAAYGSGAVALSQDKKATVLSVDIGGGTAKLSIIQQGVVTQTAAVSVGSRLIAFDNSGIVTRIEEPAKRMVSRLGFSLGVGSRISLKEQNAFSDFMAEVLFELIRGGPLLLAQEFMITKPLMNHNLDRIEHLMFSGGVSEYIYDHTKVSYGDLGPIFGQKIRARIDSSLKRNFLLEPIEGIRATVIGAGEYSLQASGATSYISSVDALPVFRLQVVRCSIDRDSSVKRVGETLRQALAKFDLDSFTDGLAFAISLDNYLDYQYLRKVAEGLAAVVKQSGNQKAPLFLILEYDVAKALGGILKEELGLHQDVIAVDGIEVGDLDYIDIGRPLGITEVIPVTVKSLIFP
ncbi:MAG: ethanolamine ammonia-lyase reactivating factor EutA [Chloroflexi bacterium]|nr:ethanolamine ammonia-lyase reactivating factor EutA [Chloroflexota bacterium]